MTTIQFKISPLLVQKNDDTVTGGISPFLFAMEAAKGYAFKFNRLARVWFGDDSVLQTCEYTEMTGYDHLIIGCQDADDLWLSFWVDRGTNSLPVAMGFQSDGEIIFTPVYQEAEFLIKPTDEDIKAIFDHISGRPDCIAIQQKR
jgi:hypothetical protein